MKDVNVKVNEAGRNDQPVHAQRLACAGGIDFAFDGRNHAAPHGHILGPIEAIPGVDHAATLEQYIVVLRSHHGRQREYPSQEFHAFTIRSLVRSQVIYFCCRSDWTPTCEATTP